MISYDQNVIYLFCYRKEDGGGGWAVEVHQISNGELEGWPALDPLVEMDEQFHVFFAYVVLGAGQFEQDRAQEFVDDVGQLVVRFGAAHTQENAFQEFYTEDFKLKHRLEWLELKIKWV